MSIRPHLSARDDAPLAGEARLYIGQVVVVRPPVAADRRPMGSPRTPDTRISAILLRVIYSKVSGCRGAESGCRADLIQNKYFPLNRE